MKLGILCFTEVNLTMPLVALNNVAGHYTDSIFYRLVTDLIQKLKSITGISDIEALDYDAAVDVLDLEFVES